MGALALVVLSFGLGGCTAEPARDPLRLGAALPPIELVGLDGQTVSSQDWVGLPTVINFWATWCIPCRKEIPVLQELSEGGAVRVLGIDLDEGSEQAVRDFVERSGMTYPILLGNQKVFERLDGSTIPYTLVLDSDGLLSRIYRGPVTAKELLGELEAVGAPATSSLDESVRGAS